MRKAGVRRTWKKHAQKCENSSMRVGRRREQQDWESEDVKKQMRMKEENIQAKVQLSLPRIDKNKY